MAAAGAVAFRFTYRGFTDALLSDLRHAPFSEVVDQYRFFRYYVDTYQDLALDPATGLVDLEVAASEARLASGMSDFERGRLSFHRGAFAAAVRQIESDVEKRGESEEKLFWLAMSYLRVGEVENCLDHLLAEPRRDGEPPMSGFHHSAMAAAYCTLPIEQVHREREPAQRAAALFQRLLESYRPGDELYRWLLNFCHMALGLFPEGVPEEHRIDSEFAGRFYGPHRERTAERFAALSFRDRAGELGVDTLDSGKGVAVEDFNGDGYLDIVTGGTFSDLRYYVNEAGRRFVERTAESGLGGVSQPYIITAADYDNDGRMDLFVGRPFTFFRLFRNQGDGTFSDATFSSGLLEAAPAAGEAVYSCVSAWADVDNDGDLDLFLAQFGQRLPLFGGLLGRKPMSSKLFLNQGGRFTDGTESYDLSGIVEDQIFLGAAFGDYDGDGWPDLFLSSFNRSRSVLLRNVGGSRFEPVPLARTPEPGFMAAFVDVDHDGWLDLFQTSQGPARTTTRRTVFGDEPERNAPRILLNTGGRLVERKDLFRGRMPIGSMGASYGDLNNDGCLDFYLGTGNPEGWFVLPNLMFLGEAQGSRCTGMMDNISMLQGFGTIQKGHGIVFFDFDNDGDQDIYSSLGGMWPGDAWPNQLFVNDSRTSAAWLKIRLRGHRTNRFGVGAMIRVTARDASGETIVRTYHMDNKTGFGSAPYLAHIGLGPAVAVDEVEVWWPASKTLRSYDAELSRLNVLSESGGAVEPGGLHFAAGP